MRRLVKYTLTIEETHNNPQKKYPVAKRVIKLPIDSKGKQVFQQHTRATSQLIYLLCELGYTYPRRVIDDGFFYDSDLPWNEQLRED